MNGNRKGKGRSFGLGGSPTAVAVLQQGAAAGDVGAVEIVGVLQDGGLEQKLTAIENEVAVGPWLPCEVMHSGAKARLRQECDEKEERWGL